MYWCTILWGDDGIIEFMCSIKQFIASHHFLCYICFSRQFPGSMFTNISVIDHVMFCLQWKKFDRKYFPTSTPFFHLLYVYYTSYIHCNNISSLMLHYLDFHDCNVVYICCMHVFTNVVPSFLPLFILVNLFCHMGLHRVLDSYIVTWLYDFVPFNKMLLVIYFFWHLQ